MIQYKNIKQVDIAKGTAVIVNLNTIFQGDANANRVGAIVYENGEPLALTGTCAGVCRRNDGNEVPLTGVVEGSQAYVVLDANCYAVQGPIQVFVKWLFDNYEVTLICAFGTVVGSGGDALIQPVERIPDYAQLVAEIDRMRIATTNAEAAAAHSIRYDVAQALQESQRKQARENVNAPAKVDIGLEFDQSHDYKLGDYVFSPNDGFLYRFTSNKDAGDWNGNVVVKVDLADQINSDISNLKDKIGTVPPNTNVENQIFDLAYRVSANTTDIGVVQRTIGSGLSPDNTVKSQLDGIKADIGTVPSGSTVEDQITDLQDSIGTVPSGSTVEDQITDLQDSIGTVPTGKTVEGQISELTTEVMNNRGYIGDLTAAIEQKATISIVNTTLVISSGDNFYNQYTWSSQSSGLSHLTRGAHGTINVGDGAGHQLIAFRDDDESTYHTRGFYVLRGVAPIVNKSDHEPTIYYPIPVPAEASKMTLQLQDSSMYLCPYLYKYVGEGSYDLINNTEISWYQGSRVSTFTPSTGLFVGISCRYDSRGSAFLTEPELLLTFE